MTRYHEPYTLYSREMIDGRKVWYYRTYDENGKRRAGRSTGEILKGKAREFCEE